MLSDFECIRTAIPNKIKLFPVHSFQNPYFRKRKFPFMIEKSRGIVLHQVWYSDTSRIVHLYTEHFGRLAFMVKGIGRKGRFHHALFQPLTLLEVEIAYRSGRSLQTLRSAHHETPLPDLFSDIRKTTIALFLGEILYKTLGEEETNPPLFRFLHTAVTQLENEKHPALFPLIFLVHLTHYLGFPPANRFTDRTAFFDLREGSFVPQPPLHDDFLSTSEARYLSWLLEKETEEEVPLPPDKKGFFEKILRYYQIHLEGMRNINSLEVLHSVFH